MDSFTTETREPGARDPAPGDLRTLQLFLNSNNIEAGTDELVTPQAASSWLAHHGLTDDTASVRNDEDLVRLIDIREGIRLLLASDHADSQITTEDMAGLASLFAGSAASFRSDASGLVRLVPTGNGLDSVVTRLASIVHEAQLTGLWRRFKVCSNDGCRWAYWDSSRNSSGRWCSMSICGNRAKVSAHRQRRSGG